MEQYGEHAAAMWLEIASGASPPPHSPDAHLDLLPKARKKDGSNSTLRHSAMPCASSPAHKMEEEVLSQKDRERLSHPLRQSAMPGDSAQAQGIVTMENADVDSIIVGLAAVVRAYTRESATATRRGGLASRGASMTSKLSAKFDEQAHPLDQSGVWRRPPPSALVEEFVRRVVFALELDESSVVLGLILIERAMSTTKTPLTLSARTWRPALLMAIVLASKIVYDEKVFLADYRQQLPQYDLKYAPQQELAFLDLVGYNTTVRRGEYAKYYYALEVRARASPGLTLHFGVVTASMDNAPLTHVLASRVRALAGCCAHRVVVRSPRVGVSVYDARPGNVSRM